MATTDDTDANRCPHTLHLGAQGWGVGLRCTLNRGHRSDVHVGPVYPGPQDQARHILAPGTTAIEWRADNLDAPELTMGGRLTSAHGDFPGTALDLDLLTVIARIEQVNREGAGTAGGIVWERILTCDVPRLRGHIDPDALEWADRTPWGPTVYRVFKCTPANHVTLRTNPDADPATCPCSVGRRIGEGFDLENVCGNPVHDTGARLERVGSRPLGLDPEDVDGGAG